MPIYMWMDTIPVTWISLSTTSATTTSTWYQINATVTPDNATNKTVIWTSSKPEVATINSSWWITRVGSPDTVVFTATTEDWWFTATCTITFQQGCFLKWTPILTKDWYKNIEDIVEWDIVLSFNETKKEIEYNEVINFIKHPYKWCIIKLNWWLIEATYNHLVYVSKDKEKREYKLIWDVNEWEWLYTNNWYIKVTSKDEREYDWDVYNMTVNKNHNYFVYDWILVHNATTWWACFLKWTSILMKYWRKNIEDIVEWDIVLSFNEEKWQVEYNEVIDFIKHYYDGNIIKLNWWLIEATDTHPVYSSRDKNKREYILIWDINEWDWIYTNNWYIEVVSKEEWEYKWDVYNLTVDNNHNYFVWDWVLVHNAVSA